MSKPLRVLFAFDMPYPVERAKDYTEDLKDRTNFATEADVQGALLDNGYEVRMLGLFKDLQPLLEELKEFKPDVVFNTVDTFRDVTGLDKNVAGLFEMLNVPYTGASPAALFICNDKALSRKVLRYHRVRGPRFQTFYRGHRVWLPRTLKLPCIVKPLTEEASRGISQASIVDDEPAFIERVKMVHDRMNQDAIAEQYIEGRELYVTVIGDHRLRVLPPREMTFGDLPADEPRIATFKAKWDDAYRKKWGIRNTDAGPLDQALHKRVVDICKRAYRALNIRSYARFDLRITAEGNVYIIEPNANPCIAKDDELAMSALKAGIDYPSLIRMVVRQALKKRH